MKQALETLEYIDGSDKDRDFLLPNECYQLDEAITNLRTAIEQAKRQQALDKMAENERELGIQMQPEPVAWMYPDDYERMLTSETFCTVYSVEVVSPTRGESTVALYTTLPATDHIPDVGEMVGPCKYPKCPYPCPDLPDCKDAEKQQAPAAVVNQQLTTEAAAPVQDSNHEFQNFHRLLCERFGYTHDEVDWKRDQISLIEWIAKQVKPTPVQEPCAECFGQGIQGEDGDGIVSGVTWKCDACNGSGKEHPAPAAPVQEPVAFIVNPDGEEQLSWCQPTYSKSTPLYTTPPAAQRQWQGLTDEEVAVLMMEAWGCASIAPRNAPNFARAIEAKLREKNGGAM
jgi:hypothetical protein